jgi:flagellar biosynthetic protein FliR
VTELGPATVLGAFVIFCRIGTCLMLMPGISSPRVPAQIRLLLALALTLALTPLLLPMVQPALVDLAPVTLAPLIVSEILIGAMIGMLGRIFFLSLQMLATVASNAVGFGNIPGSPAIEEGEALPELVSLITLTATVLLFLTDQHWEILRALAASYSALPPTGGYGAQFGLMQIANSLSQACFLALRITSPFIVYSVIVNLAIGLTNKLTPQIPVYFISAPFVLLGGLFLLYFTVKEFLRLFMDGFSGWLAGG